MLGVVRHPGREAVAPLLVDLEGVRRTKRFEPPLSGVDAGLLQHFPRCSGLGRLVQTVERAGDRLPVVAPPGALEKEDLKSRRVHHHEHGVRQLRRHFADFSLYRMGSASAPSASMNTAKNERPRPPQNSALEASTSRSTPRSSRATAAKPSMRSTWPSALRQERSPRQSSSASQLRPNQSGNSSAPAKAASTSPFDRSILVKARLLPCSALATSSSRA